MKILSRCFIIILPFLFFNNVFVFAEGTKQIRPTATDIGQLSVDGGYTPFATIGATEKYRINIHISNVGETILFGLQGRTSNNRTYNLRKPDGTVVLTANCPNAVGQTGYIADWAGAVAGPFPASGGYTPLSYQVTNSLELGDYYIDFSGSIDFPVFDFQVVTGANSPALPGDAINGRVWSGAWQFYANLNPFEPFSGKLFVYSDDGIVTSCRYNGAHVGRFTMFCNPYGCVNTGNFGNDRKSRLTNTSLSFPGIAQYKVFLNNPDIIVYPDGVYGTMIGTPTIIPDPAFPPCSGEKVIVVNVNKGGNVEILIDVPFGDATYDVSLFAIVGAGINNIPWDGKDGHGTPVPDGTHLGITVTYVNGLTNLPIWDQEQNPQGYVVTLERPINPSVSNPKTYWDDTNLSGAYCPTTLNLTGCSPTSTGCHIWGGSTECHDKMINTWWYSASSSTANIDTYHTGTPPLPTALPQWGCGPGIVHLSATVLAQEDVRWWDQQTGGALLWTGTPFNVNLPAVGVYHFWAEAYNPASTCTSANRLDVVAEAVEIPSPPAPFGNSFFTCGPGNVTIVTTNSNPGIRIDWYDDATPPNKLISGNSYTTPVISVNTTYYAEAVEIGSPDGCSSATRTQFIAEVRPVPQNSNSQPPAICSGSNFILALNGNLPGTNHSWTATCNPPGSVTGFTSSQTTPISGINDPLVNITTSNATVTYHVTPQLNSCIGTAVDLVVTVKPTPHLTNASPAPICGLAPFNMLLVSDVAGGNFTWTATCSPVGSVTGFTVTQATGVTLINDFLTNTTAASASVTYAITPHAFGCDGAITNYTVTLEPTPHLTNSAPDGICSGDPFNASLLCDV
ncbi:MAG: PKD-like domain-containing protein, partial [Bacteroidota bacterium]